MIDFCSGLTYALDGGMQRIAEKMFLLTPAQRRGLRRGKGAAARQRLLQPVLTRARGSPRPSTGRNGSSVSSTGAATLRPPGRPSVRIVSVRPTHWRTDKHERQAPDGRRRGNRSLGGDRRRPRPRATGLLPPAPQQHRAGASATRSGTGLRRTSSSCSATAWARRRSPPPATTRASTTTLNVDRMPFTGFDTTWSVKPAAAPPYLPDYDPDSASTGTMWATGQKTHRRADLAGPEQRRKRARARTCKTVLEIAQERGHEGRQRLDRRDHRRDAGRARLAHLAARLPGPGQHGRLPDRDQGRRRPRLDRRAGGRPQGRRRSSAAAAAASSRPITGGPDAARPSSQSAQDKGYQYVTDAAGLAAVDQREQAGARPVQRRQHVARVEPARRRRSARATPPVACTEDQPPGERAEPGRHDRRRRSSLLRQPQGLLPAGRGRLDRQAGPRHQRLRPDRRDRRLRQGDRRRARLPAQPPRHADRRHRRPLAHQPDRGRGRERHRPADRLLDEPAHQGRPDAER